MKGSAERRIRKENFDSRSRPGPADWKAARQGGPRGFLEGGRVPPFRRFRTLVPRARKSSGPGGPGARRAARRGRPARPVGASFRRHFRAESSPSGRRPFCQSFRTNPRGRSAQGGPSPPPSEKERRRTDRTEVKPPAPPVLGPGAGPGASFLQLLLQSELVAEGPQGLAARLGGRPGGAVQARSEGSRAVGFPAPGVLQIQPCPPGGPEKNPVPPRLPERFWPLVRPGGEDESAFPRFSHPLRPSFRGLEVRGVICVAGPGPFPVFKRRDAEGPGWEPPVAVGSQKERPRGAGRPLGTPLGRRFQPQGLLFWSRRAIDSFLPPAFPSRPPRGRPCDVPKGAKSEKLKGGEGEGSPWPPFGRFRAFASSRVPVWPWRGLSRKTVRGTRGGAFR